MCVDGHRSGGGIFTMETIVSISKGATDCTLPTLAEVKDELSTLAKIRRIIRARSTSESDKLHSGRPLPARSGCLRRSRLSFRQP